MSLDFIRSLTLAVLVLGLISCTVNKQPDPWQRKVRAEWIEDRKVHSESLTALTAPTVPVDAKLIFDGAEISSGSFSSVCKSLTPNIAKAQRSGALNASSVVVTDLLPREIWLQMGWTRESTISCSVQFDLVNSAGSTWSFKIPALTVKRLDQLVNLKVSQATMHSQTNALISSDDPYDFEGFGETSVGVTTVDLICEKFQNSRTVMRPTMMSEIARDLVYGEVAAKLGSDDQRDLFQDQNCQIAVEATDNAGVVTHRLTQTFAVSFSAPRLEYDIGELSLPLGEGVADATNAVVLKMSVKNKSQNPQRFRIYQAQGRNIALQAVISDPYKESYQVAPETFAHLEYQIIGAMPAGEFENDPIYEIPTGETATITAQLKRDYHCLFSETELFLGSPEKYRSLRGLAVGTFYRFPASKILGRVRRQIGKPDKFEPSGKINEKGLIEPYGSTHGWTPIQYWKDVRGGDPVSPLVQVPDGVCAPKGQVLPLKF